MIHYSLYKNEKIAGENRYLARVHPHGTLSRKDVIRRALQRGTTFTESDLDGAWDLLEATGIDCVLDGWNVAMPCGTLQVNMRGTYEGYQDRYDRKRHSVSVQFRTSNHVRKQIKNNAQLKRIDPHDLRPLLVAFLDVNTGRYDQVLSPGRTGRIFGDRLKFDPHDRRQGVFIVGADRNVTPVEEVPENTPRSLILLIPPLPIGCYKLAVRASYGGSEDLAVGVLDHVLRVAPPELLLEEPDQDFASQAIHLLEMGRQTPAENDPRAAR